jgi:hypothetical protein
LVGSQLRQIDFPLGFDLVLALKDIVAFNPDIFHSGNIAMIGIDGHYLSPCPFGNKKGMREGAAPHSPFLFLR